MSSTAIGSERYATAVYDFIGSAEQKTLTMFAGDILKVKCVTESQWWLSELNGNSGFVPRSYVMLKEQGWTPIQLNRGNTGKFLITTKNGGEVNDDHREDDEPEQEDSPRSKKLLEGKDGDEDEDRDLTDDDDDDATTVISGKSGTQPSQQQQGNAARRPAPNDYVNAVALFSFEKTHPRHLAMKKRDRVRVVPPKEGEKLDWLEACVGEEFGIVPANRVYILKPGETEPPQPKKTVQHKSPGGMENNEPAMPDPEPRRVNAIAMRDSIAPRAGGGNNNVLGNLLFSKGELIEIVLPASLAGGGRVERQKQRPHKHHHHHGGGHSARQEGGDST